MKRHPGGRTCLPMLPVVALFLPYAMMREVAYRVKARIRT